MHGQDRNANITSNHDFFIEFAIKYEHFKPPCQKTFRSQVRDLESRQRNIIWASFLQRSVRVDIPFKGNTDQRGDNRPKQ